MTALIHAEDRDVLEALSQILDTPRIDVKLVRDTDLVVKAFLKVITEDRRASVESYWTKRKEDFLIPPG
jgi:hypothetical protein